LCWCVLVCDVLVCVGVCCVCVVWFVEFDVVADELPSEDDAQKVEAERCRRTVSSAYLLLIID
jgi:hypothetical protein